MDSKYLAYTIFFYQGVGNLFAWNAFINAGTYFENRFCGTNFRENFQNYFSLSYSVSQTIGLALSIKFKNKLSLQMKIVAPLIVYSLIFFMTSIAVTVEINPKLLFWLTLLSTTLSGLCGALLSGGLFGLAAVFPAWFTGGLMNGQGLAGLVVSLSDIFTSLINTNDSYCDEDNAAAMASICPSFSIDASALAYFVIATVIMVSCVGAFLVLQNMTITKHYLGESVGATRVSINSKLKREMDDKEEARRDLETRLLTQPLITPESVRGKRQGSGGTEIYIISNSNSPFKQEDLQSHGSEDSVSRRPAEDGASVSFDKILALFRTIRVPAFSVLFTFVVTIGLFPALVQHLASMHRCQSQQRFFDDLFVPFLFLLFNLFDFVGRVTANVTVPLFSAENIWIPAIARVVFFPLLLLCNVKGSQLPLVFSSDAWPVLFIALFAFSNGYIGSACMMLGPSMVGLRSASLAGSIMIFALTAGLLGGACVSFLTLFVSQGYV